jgi:hypothetical protein
VAHRQHRAWATSCLPRSPPLHHRVWRCCPCSGVAVMPMHANKDVCVRACVRARARASVCTAVRVSVCACVCGTPGADGRRRGCGVPGRAGGGGRGPPTAGRAWPAGRALPPARARTHKYAHIRKVHIQLVGIYRDVVSHRAYLPKELYSTRLDLAPDQANLILNLTSLGTLGPGSLRA